MNELTIYCNRLFQAEGMSLYRFCNIHNLERTSIRRLLSGERLPKEEQFRAFVMALSITPAESDKLHQLYEREKIGPIHYDNRLFIKKILEEIGEEQHFHFSRDMNISYLDLPLKNVMETMLIQNFKEIRYLIHYLFSSAEDFIYSNISIDQPQLFEILQQAFYGKKTSVPFFHLFTILKKVHMYHNTNYNLNIFLSVVPFSFQINSAYDPLYSYGHPVIENDSTPFPYYILTSKYLLSISLDGKEAILSANPILIQAYEKHCKKIRSHSKHLITHSNDLMQILKGHSAALLKTGNPAKLLYTFDFFPCLFQIYTKELFWPHLKKEYRHNTALMEIMNQFSSNIKKVDVYEAFMIYEGLISFTKTGILSDCTSFILDPFNKKERRAILEQLERSCLNGSYRLHLLPKNYFFNQPQVNIELYDDHKLSLISINKDHLFSRIRLSENSIYDSFLDYFEGLMQNPAITTPEESAQIIHFFIEKYL